MRLVVEDSDNHKWTSGTIPDDQNVHASRSTFLRSQHERVTISDGNSAEAFNIIRVEVKPLTADAL